MNKNNINVPLAGTTDDSLTTAENQHGSQPNANTNVVGSLLGQREIKFRAWDGNRMRDVFKILFTETDGLIIYFKSTESGKEPGHLIERDSRLKLMQYTGLKDKNGKEIYEGDILNGRNRILKIVYWCDKRAAFCESEQFKPIPAKHSFAKLYDKFGKIFNKNGRLENHFIVGNIFENPELLETLR